MWRESDALNADFANQRQEGFGLHDVVIMIIIIENKLLFSYTDAETREDWRE